MKTPPIVIGTIAPMAKLTIDYGEEKEQWPHTIQFVNVKPGKYTVNGIDLYEMIKHIMEASPPIKDLNKDC